MSRGERRSTWVPESDPPAAIAARSSACRLSVTWLIPAESAMRRPFAADYGEQRLGGEVLQDSDVRPHLVEFGVLAAGRENDQAHRPAAAAQQSIERLDSRL